MGGRRAGRARLPVSCPHGWPWPRFSKIEDTPVERSGCGRGDVAEGSRRRDMTAPTALRKPSPEQGEAAQEDIDESGGDHWHSSSRPPEVVSGVARTSKRGFPCFTGGESPGTARPQARASALCLALQNYVLGQSCSARGLSSQESTRPDATSSMRGGHQLRRRYFMVKDHETGRRCMSVLFDKTGDDSPAVVFDSDGKGLKGRRSLTSS